MASRGSVLRAQLGQALTDESVLLVRWCGVLVRITLATLAYRYVLKECLPGQFALWFLSILYGISVIQLLPGASTPRGFANWLAIAARFLPREFRGRLGEASGPDDRSESRTAADGGERHLNRANHKRTNRKSPRHQSSTVTPREKGRDEDTLRVNRR